VMAMSYLVATLIAIGTGAVMGLFGLLSPELPLARPLLVAAALGGLVLLAGLARPAVFNRMVSGLARLLRRDLPDATVTPPALALAVLLECLGWTMLGVHLWLLARPLGASSATLPVTVGVFALAFVAGLVLVPLPAGLGVREGLLVAALAPSLGTGVAVTAALLSRLVLVVVDLALAAGTGALGLARRSAARAGGPAAGPPATAPAPPDPPVPGRPTDPDPGSTRPPDVTR
jgi:glycosyltransferase 2 family protein